MNLRQSSLVLAVTFALLPTAGVQAAQDSPADSAPHFRVNPPDSYKSNISQNFSPGKGGRPASTTISGVWHSPKAGSKADQPWSITVIKGEDPQVMQAYNARNAATMTIAKDDFGGANPYLYAGVERLTLPWGKAIAYFVQASKDGKWREPNNEQLRYQIRGVTDDKKYTIIGRFQVRLAQLPTDSQKAQDASGDLRKLHAFESYKLLNQEDPNSFEPSLIEMQNLVGSVRISPEISESKPNTTSKPKPTPTPTPGT
ncbi:MAG: hypothetical protein JO308_07135 [Verrucomicrobia bacterium]|nr:hypothetical protein [Verrucomicrobiota bacterium]